MGRYGNVIGKVVAPPLLALSATEFVVADILALQIAVLKLSSSDKASLNNAARW